MSRQKTIILLTLIFLISTSLRLGFVRFNRQSNDDHIEVIQLILKSDRLPEKSDCNECYQPKLFHFTSAKILQLSGLDNLSNDKTILAVELINFTAGILTLLVIGIFLICLPEKNELAKVLAFGLLALNPKLIGINSQATNDTFVILFSTLALFFTFLFWKKQRRSYFILIILFCIFGISSKTNGWVIPLAIFLALLIKTWIERKKVVGNILLALIFGSITLVVSYFNPLNQYYSNYQKYSSPILLNIQPIPFPSLNTPSTYRRPGLISIQDGIFTFKFKSLLEYPRIENGVVFPAHRTSLWTQLYGRAHTVHFDNHPSSWSTTGDQGFTISRIIYILALLPTALLLIGIVREIVLVLRSIIRRDENLTMATNYGLTAATFSGVILFILLYALLYRDFAVMKVIFIYPALITFPLLFMGAFEQIKKFSAKLSRILHIVFGVWVVALFGFYIVDIVTMIILIYSRRYGL